MLTALFAAFIGGVILNLMPCVFPIISLKALSLLNQQGNIARARAEGIAFLAGVMITMMLLAGVLLAARAGGMAVGWGFQLQSPLVISLLALVILAAALNLLGTFEAGLSLQRAGTPDSSHGTWLRAGLTGALAIVVATPCSAPFMAGAIGYALVQPPSVALAIFFALGLGFAAPFSLISLFPVLASRLPRPGVWMQLLKRGLAFPMFAAWGWLVWVLAQQAGTAALGTLLACSVALSFALWLYGLAQQRQFAGKRPIVLWTLTAALMVAVLAPLPGMMKSASPPMVTPTTQNITPVMWSPQKVARLRGHGQPIFVNFTASWCITCQVNDKTSLTAQAVKSAMARTRTLYMVADSTKFNADIDDAMSTFGQGGLPLYVVYPADGSPPKVLPQILTPAIVVNALNQAADQHS